MAGRQLGFEFPRPPVPSPATVELAAARARAGSVPRGRQDGAGPAAAHAALPSTTGQPIPEPGSPPARNASELGAALELALRARFRGPLRLIVTDNRRTMVSMRRDKRAGLLEARVHHMFLQAEPEIWTALGDYLCSGERDAAQQIARYIEQHRLDIRRPQRRALALSPHGIHHDLSEICRTLNERYFAGQARVSITWSRERPPRQGAGRRSIKLGSYTSRDRVVRVHPALDAAFVPRYFVEYIVFHELLHHVMPPQLHNGRRELHGPSFQARERQFEHYRAALRWERENLGELLSARARRLSPRKPKPAPARG